MIIERIEHKIDKKLPDRYKNFLNEIDDYCYVTYNEFRDEFPDDEGVSWFFGGKKRLEELTVIDGATENRSAWEVIKSYAEIRPGVTDHVDSFVAIAEDNGDILYLDARDNFSVWVYMHDSGESKKLEDSFDVWMGNALFDV